MTFEHAVEDWKSNDEWQFADKEAAWKFFYHAAIQHYKDSVLKDAGEPVAYMTTDEDGSASMLFFDRAEALKYSGDEEPVNLFTESQLAAAQEDITEMRADHLMLAEENHALREQLATAEQRVAEACAKVANNLSTKPWVHCPTSSHAVDLASFSIAKIIRSGEWRKHMKGE